MTLRGIGGASPLFFSKRALRSATDNKAGSFVLFGLLLVSNTAARFAMPGQRRDGEAISIVFTVVGGFNCLSSSSSCCGFLFACE